MPKQCRREEVVSTQLALLTVVSPWVRGQESWLVLIFGVVGVKKVRCFTRSSTTFGDLHPQPFS